MALLEPLEPSVGGRRRLRLSNPATGEELGVIELRAAAEVEGVVARARKAALEWGETPIVERRKVLGRGLRFLVAHQDEFVEAIVGETGKPREEVLATELLPACDALQFWARRSKGILADRTVPLHLFRHKRLRIGYRPLGVVGILTPWSLPFLAALCPTIQALVAGNAVVLKPSEITPFSGQLVERLLGEAGLPADAFQLLLGDAEVGAALVEADVDRICFAGRVATGREVGMRCAERLVPCTLLLGGKDPMIVCADADLERASAGAVYGAFARAGQVCTSIERVYVVDEVADEFIRKVLEKTAVLRQGPGGEADVGALTHAPQLEVIEEQVADALRLGARVRAGGRRNPAFAGLYYEPTVLTDVDPRMKVMREQTLGPVLPIMRVRDEGEALRLARDARQAPSGSVWTRDKRRGLELARALGSGSVHVNDCLIVYGVAEAPFGGRGESGLGQVGGEEGLRSYCHAQPVLIDRFGPKSEFHWFPYRVRRGRLLERLMKLVWGTPLGRLLT